VNIPRRKHSIPPEIPDNSPRRPNPRPNRPESGQSGRGRARSRPSPLAGRERPDSVQPGGIRPFCQGNSQIPSIPARSRPVGWDPAVLFGERSDPVHPAVLARERPNLVQPAGIRSFLDRTVGSRPSGCFGHRLGSPARTGSGDGKRICPIFLRTDEGYFCICVTCHVS
jgi:hypothetical protein